MLTAKEKDIIQRLYEPIPGDVDETAKRMVGWSRTFFGDPINKAHYWIRTATTPDIHYGLYRALAREDKLIAVTSPRGFAKTTIDSLIYPLYRIYYSLDPVIILIGKIEGSAKRVLRNIKREISLNLKLREVYGALRPANTKDSLWAAHEARTANDIFIRSIGMGGDIRGSLDSMYRPTLIIIDDPQSIITMREPAKLEAHEEYFDSDVMYALDEQYGKIRFVGNFLGKQCLLAKVMKDKRFKVVSFSAVVDKKDGTPCKTLKDIMTRGKSTWEEMFAIKKLRELAEHAFNTGKFHVFMLQRQNIITEQFERNLKGFKIHDLTFQRMGGQNVLVGDEYPDPIRVNTYLTIDPAYADDESADERALIVFAKGRILRATNWGKPYFFNCLWVLEYLYNHMPPDEIIDKSLDFHRKYYFNAVITETISGGQILNHLQQKAIVQDEFYSRFPFQCIPVNSQKRSKKERIIDALQPRMKLGQIFFRNYMLEIKDECENFEMYKSPHLMDALEVGNRFSFECTEQYLGAHGKHMEYVRRVEEDYTSPRNNMYQAPRSLKTIMNL